MDAHFNNILNVFKRLDEGNEGNFGKPATLDQPSPAAAAQAKSIVQKAADDRAISLANMARVVPDEKNINTDVEEDSMTDAEEHSTGPKFTGYWKGTDKRTPGKHMVGASESIEEEIAREYSQYLKEYGMTTGGTTNPSAGATNPTDLAKQQKDLNQVQQNLNKFKSAGVTLPTGTGQAAKSTLTTLNNPNANPATGQGMDQNSKKLAGSLGQEMEKLLTTGNPSQVQQVANAIKQSKLGAK
jgi:hypothetical protein